MNYSEKNLNKVKQTKKLDIFFSFMFLVGLYSGISLYITDELFIPYILCGISSIYFFINNFYDLKTFQIIPFFYIAVITCVGIIFSDKNDEFFFEKIKGFIQLFYSMFISYIFYLNLKKWEPKKVSNLFMIFIILILIGAFLEIFTDFKEISDKLRGIIYRSNLYDADLRDIYFYGIVRPKLFTEEPSHVAKFFILSLFVWFSLTKIRMRYYMMLLFLILGLFMIRSPIIFLFIPICFIVEIFYRKKINFYFKIKYKGIAIDKSFSVLIILATIIVILFFNNILEKRINLMIGGYDDSFSIRFTGPFLIAVEVLKKYPLWGAGISGKEAISEIIDNIYYKIGVKYYSIYGFSTNIIFSYLIYYGYLGAVLFGIGLLTLVKRLKIDSKVFLFSCFIIFGQTMGGFASLRPWGYFFIIATVSKFSKHYLQRNNGSIIYSKIS